MSRLHAFPDELYEQNRMSSGHVHPAAPNPVNAPATQKEREEKPPSNQEVLGEINKALSVPSVGAKGLKGKKVGRGLKLLQ
jgi:hypothetical protein